MVTESKTTDELDFSDYLNIMTGIGTLKILDPDAFVSLDCERTVKKLENMIKKLDSEQTTYHPDNIVHFPKNILC
jgi:hypothetical protein